MFLLQAVSLCIHIELRRIGLYVTYLDGRRGTQTPVVVKVEADQTKDGKVEEDVPAWDEAAVAVECVAEVPGWCDVRARTVP